MPATVERQLARLRARFAQAAREVEDIGFVLKGSVIQRYRRCSSVGCHCRADPPQLHGPYWQWSSKVKAKTVSRLLNDEQARRYQQWIDNGKRLEEIVQELYGLSDQADAILRRQERSVPPRKRNAPRRGDRSRT